MANTSIFNAFERMWQHIVAALGNKSDIDHNHDNRYYTESEINTKLSNFGLETTYWVDTSRNTATTNSSNYDWCGYNKYGKLVIVGFSLEMKQTGTWTNVRIASGFPTPVDGESSCFVAINSDTGIGHHVWVDESGDLMLETVGVAIQNGHYICGSIVYIEDTN